MDRKQINSAGKSKDNNTTKSNENFENLISSFQKLRGTWNTEKVAQSKKDQARVISILTDQLFDDDQNIIDEFTSVKEVWAQLIKKYGKLSVTAANSYVDKIQPFEFDETEGIDAAWSNLRHHRRKLIAASSNLKHTYTDDGLLMKLMNRLPDYYQTIIHGLHLFENLSPEEKKKCH